MKNERAGLARSAASAEIIDFFFKFRRRRGPVVRGLGFHAVTPGSNPVLTSGQDSFPVVLDSTLPRFVNCQLVTSCQLGFLITFLLSLNCFFQIIKSGVPVN